MAVWMGARFAFFSNASSEGNSGLTSGIFVTFFYPSFSTRLQHGPRTCSMSPSFWQANDSQLFTSWVSPEQESRPCHVCSRAVWMDTGRSVSRESETEWSCVNVARYKITNVCKPPPSCLTPTVIPTLPVCMLAISIVNMSTGATAQHLLKVRNRPSGQQLTTLPLLQDAKGVALFSSYRWNVGTNPDLAFASVGQDNRLPDRHVLGKFPRSQHRPSLIMSPKLQTPASSDPVKRWNFRKADWKRFCFLTRKSVERLPPPDIDKAYQELHESLLFASEQCILLSRRKNYVPCWEKECETLSLLPPSPSGYWLW